MEAKMCHCGAMQSESLFKIPPAVMSPSRHVALSQFVRPRDKNKAVQSYIQGDTFGHFVSVYILIWSSI